MDTRRIREEGHTGAGGPASAESLADLAVALHDEPSLEETVDLVVHYALTAVGCDYAGIIFVTGKDHVETVAATDPLLYQLDELRDRTGVAPGFEPLRQNSWVLVSDTLDEPRWSSWMGVVADLGIRSTLAVRLSTSASTVGALVLYSREPDAFDHDDLAVAELIARHAAIAVSSARKEENLWLAIDARKLIGQAQGILMERFGLTADRAFAVPMRYSQDRNIKLRDVARELVDGGSLPS